MELPSMKLWSSQVWTYARNPSRQGDGPSVRYQSFYHGQNVSIIISASIVHIMVANNSHLIILASSISSNHRTTITMVVASPHLRPHQIMAARHRRQMQIHTVTDSVRTVVLVRQMPRLRHRVFRLRVHSAILGRPQQIRVHKVLWPDQTGFRYNYKSRLSDSTTL